MTLMTRKTTNSQQEPHGQSGKTAATTVGTTMRGVHNGLSGTSAKIVGRAPSVKIVKNAESVRMAKTVASTVKVTNVLKANAVDAVAEDADAAVATVNIWKMAISLAQKASSVRTLSSHGSAKSAGTAMIVHSARNVATTAATIVTAMTGGEMVLTVARIAPIVVKIVRTGEIALRDPTVQSGARIVANAAMTSVMIDASAGTMVTANSASLVASSRSRQLRSPSRQIAHSAKNRLQQAKRNSSAKRTAASAIGATAAHPFWRHHSL